MMWRFCIMMGCLVLVSACKPSVFPYKALDGVNDKFDFSQWELLPNQQKIQLGGRIIRTDMRGDSLAIVTTQLPIGDKPADGPQEGPSQGIFVILFRTIVDPLFLREGNRVMVVGQTSTRLDIEVDHTMRSLPTIKALCVHFWNAGGEEIMIRGSSSSGNKILSELTYCNTAL
jgi:starvation-inducible outer membrane lipoprotein